MGLCQRQTYLGLQAYRRRCSRAATQDGGHAATTEGSETSESHLRGKIPQHPKTQVLALPAMYLTKHVPVTA